jgi:hypothetical protein
MDISGGGRIPGLVFLGEVEFRLEGGRSLCFLIFPFFVTAGEVGAFWADLPLSASLSVVIVAVDKSRLGNRHGREQFLRILGATVDMSNATGRDLLA